MRKASCVWLKAGFSKTILQAGAIGLLLNFAAAASLGIDDPRCEGRRNPLGIDVTTPELSWVDLRMQQQSAYQILAASEPGRLTEAKADLWNSRKVIATNCFGALYAGAALRSEQTVFWKVRVWDEKQRRSSWSSVCSFRTALLKPEDWQAQWIGRGEARSRGAENGYHALESKVDEVKWVQVDLGESFSLGAIVLYPAKPDNWKPATSGFGFPPVGRVEAADEPDFQNPIVITNWENGTALLKGDEGLRFDARGMRARFIRVTADRLYKRDRDGVFCFALAELEAWSGGTNRALGAPVSAKDSVEGLNGWAMAGLTDGHAPGKAGDADEFAAILLRKWFGIEKPVAHAVLSVCGLGYCIAEINGRRVSASELDPGFTAFDHRILYTTDDVTGLMKVGTNEVRLTLGGGWFDLATPDLFGFERAPWVAQPRALARLKLEYRDGSSETIVSDGTWEAGTGPITFQCVRGGETIDLSRSERWQPVRLMKAPNGRLQAQAHPAIGRDGEIPAVELTEPARGIFQFKLAENTAGWPRLRASGEPGQKITVRCAEDFKPDGRISRNLNSHTYGRYQTDEFILPDRAEHVFEPQFTYHGFQYVRVEGLKQKPRLDDLTAVPVHTQLEPAGTFACSDPLLNRIHEMCVRTYLCNLHGIPTDCPQREKAGWMLDGYVAAKGIGMWNFRANNLYTKWARDMADAQGADGGMPSIVPNPGWWDLLDPWWGGACVGVPWDLYQRYGNRRLLQEQFPVMQRYVDYLTHRAKGNLVDFSLGDWLEVGSTGPALRTPVELTSSLAYSHWAWIVGRTAELAGDAAAGRKYLELSQTIRDAINRKYFDAEHHRYSKDSQSALAMGLVLGVVPEDQRAAVLGELVRNIEEGRHGHISTGIVGTWFVFEALHRGGRDDVAWSMVMQPDAPGWVHMLKQGATTLWESWDGSNSRNHPALGVVDAWLFEAIGGITPDPDAIAFERVTIAPKMLGGMTWARASQKTVRGTIATDWSIKNGRLTLKVTIPCGTKAKIVLPSGQREMIKECGAGSYTFRSIL